ncbi:unnamed protein product, partial [Rotaria magnacalcarata]
MGKHPDNVIEEEDEELEEAEFIVEKILDRKVMNDEVHYFLKWKGFNDSENTWEPEVNLDCPELIAEFNKRANVQSKKPSNESTIENNVTNNNNSNKRSARDSTEQHQQRHDASGAAKKTKRDSDFGYGRGLEIEKILGATDVYGELMF